MGCDGGTIPRRDELVRVKKKPEQVKYKTILVFPGCISNKYCFIKNIIFVMKLSSFQCANQTILFAHQKDKEAELAYRWRHCSIKQLPLQTPIVACGLGRLYSKEAVLEGLLDRSVLPESAAHIKNLKDTKNLNLTLNPAYDGDTAKNGGYIDDGKSPYICPVIGLEMNGKYKFCFLWNCGCVMSERALKEIKTYVSKILL